MKEKKVVLIVPPKNQRKVDNLFKKYGVKVHAAESYPDHAVVRVSNLTPELINRLELLGVR